MLSKVTLFAIVTLIPLPLLAIGGFWGGKWVVLSVAYLTAFTLLLDELSSLAASKDDAQVEFPAATKLSVALAVAHFPLLLLGVMAVSGATGLAIWERILAFLGFGLFFGQVSNSNAHELIHRSGKWLRRLGMWVFISHLFGHHTTAHPRVHHRFVASDDDPNSARLGESYYRFARRAWIGSFRKGFEADSKIWRASPDGWWQHPYFTYVGGAVGFTLAFLVFAGPLEAVIYVILASYSTAQLLLSDYVQHYGLRRQQRPDGKLEPVGPTHSWNAPHRFSSLLMLNAPRHSDHHANPTREYPALRIGGPDSVPTLPRSLPAMGFVALIPRRWRKVMDPLAAKWSPPDAAGT